MVEEHNSEDGAKDGSEDGAGDETPEESEDVTVTKSPFAISPWDGKIQASGLFSSGNSDNDGGGRCNRCRPHRRQFRAQCQMRFSILAAPMALPTSGRWGVAYKLDHKFSERTYAYGRVSYEDNDFSGFDYRLFAGAGLGHFFADGDAVKWKVEGGPGFRYSPIDDTRMVEQEFAVYGSSEFDWVIRDGLIFEQDVNSTWTSPTTTVQSISSLRTKLTDTLSTAMSFEYRYETSPPLGRENSDTTARAEFDLWVLISFGGNIFLRHPGLDPGIH